MPVAQAPVGDDEKAAAVDHLMTWKRCQGAAIRKPAKPAVAFRHQEIAALALDERHEAGPGYHRRVHLRTTLLSLSPRLHLV